MERSGGTSLSGPLVAKTGHTAALRLCPSDGYQNPSGDKSGAGEAWATEMARPQACAQAELMTESLNQLGLCASKDVEVKSEVSTGVTDELGLSEVDSVAGETLSEYSKSPFGSAASSVSHPSTSRGVRVRLSPEQTEVLEARFQSCSYPDAAAKGALALELGLTTKQVSIWFQNKRARAKQRQHDKHSGAGAAGKGDAPGPWQEVDDSGSAFSRDPGPLLSSIVGHQSSASPFSALGISKRKLPDGTPDRPDDGSLYEDELQFSGPVKKSTSFIAGEDPGPGSRMVGRSLSRDPGFFSLEELLEDQTPEVFPPLPKPIKQVPAPCATPVTMPPVQAPVPPVEVPVLPVLAPAAAAAAAEAVFKQPQDKAKKFGPGSPGRLFGRAKASTGGPEAQYEMNLAVPSSGLFSRIRKATSKNQAKPSPSSQPQAQGQAKLGLDQAQKILEGETPSTKQEKEDILMAMKRVALNEVQDIKLTPTPRSWKSPESLAKFLESLK